MAHQANESMLESTKKYVINQGHYMLNSCIMGWFRSILTELDDYEFFLYLYSILIF
jgi:hypothetical protein